MKFFNKSEFEAVLCLIYTCIILAAMEYFFIPPRMQAILSSQTIGGWLQPTLEAGLYWSLSCLIGFALIPMIFIKFIFKNSILNFGFNTKNFFSHMRIYLGLFLFMLPFVYMASLQPEFRNLYPFIPQAKHKLSSFIIWEIFYILQFFCLEFFFRGYLIYTLEKHMNKFIAIAVMVVPYTMIHFHKPFPETFGAIGAGIVLGYLSLKYRSWLGGAVLHSLVAITIEILSVRQSGLF